MTILDMIFLGLLCFAILCVLFSCLFLGSFISVSSKLKKLPKKRIKNKKKRKSFLIKRNNLRKKKRSSLKMGIILLIAAFVGGGSAAYASYYQAMNLTNADSDSVVQAYFLIEDLEAELGKMGTAAESREKLEGNVSYLANATASYGTKTASYANSEEGQLILNRYYRSIEELGKNISKVYHTLYNDQQAIDRFQSDIKKLKEKQKRVLDYYKVNEDALKREKQEQKS